MTQEEKLICIIKALDSKKAQDIKVLKVRDLTIIADYFVIANGTSTTQTRALADEVEFQMKESGTAPEQIQTDTGSNWIILDYGDILVHVFYKETREFYSLERLWRDGEEIDISQYLN